MSKFEIQEMTIDISLFFALMYILFFFSLNGRFDTELVHLYLSDRVQMSIKYHNDPGVVSSDGYPGPPKRIGRRRPA